MIIRKMETGDISKVSSMVKKYFGDFPDYYNTSYFTKEDTMYLLAFNDFNKLVGLCSLNKCDKYFDLGTNCYEIGEVIITEEYRKVGLSNLLVHEILNYVPFGKEVYVSGWGLIKDGDKGNTFLKKVLEQNHFVSVREDIDYYSNKGDCGTCIYKDVPKCRCYNHIFKYVTDRETSEDLFDLFV